MIDFNDENDKTAYEKIVEHAKKKFGTISWGAVVRDDDGKAEEFLCYNRPCYGEIRRYGPGSTRPQDEEPSDLRRFIPEKTREAIAFPLWTLSNSVEEHNKLIEFFLSTEESPYRKGLNNSLELHRDSENRVVAFSMHDTSFDPTVLVALLIMLKHEFYKAPSNHSIDRLLEKGLTYRQAILAWLFTRKSAPFGGGLLWHTSYFLDLRLNPSRFFDGEVQDLNEGLTWGEGVDYNRPDISHIFRKTNSGREEGELEMNLIFGVDTYEKIIEAAKQIKI